MSIMRCVLAAAIGVLIMHSAAYAAEIRVLSTIAAKSVMEDLIRDLSARVGIGSL